MQLLNRCARQTLDFLPRPAAEIESVAAQIIPKDDSAGGEKPDDLLHRRALTTSTRTAGDISHEGIRDRWQDSRAYFPQPRNFPN